MLLHIEGSKRSLSFQPKEDPKEELNCFFKAAQLVYDDYFTSKCPHLSQEDFILQRKVNNGVANL